MVLQFLIAWFATRLHHHQDHVIVYLHEENRILKAKLQGRPLRLTDTERRLAVLAHPIDRKHLKDVSSIATPDALQRWYRRLIVQEPGPKTPGKLPGRPRVAQEIEPLAVRMANENPTWGYRRIQGVNNHVTGA